MKWTTDGLGGMKFNFRESRQTENAGLFPVAKAQV
jgi:hypothetical protein